MAVYGTFKLMMKTVLLDSHHFEVFGLIGWAIINIFLFLPAPTVFLTIDFVGNRYSFPF
jgi:hypothetical protein